MDETRVKDNVSEIKVHRIEDTFDHAVNLWKIRTATHKKSTDIISKLSVENFRKNKKKWPYGNNEEFHAFSYDTVVDMRENFDVSSEYLNNL